MQNIKKRNFFEILDKTFSQDKDVNNYNQEDEIFKNGNFEDKNFNNNSEYNNLYLEAKKEALEIMAELSSDETSNNEFYVPPRVRRDIARFDFDWDKFVEDKKNSKKDFSIFDILMKKNCHEDRLNLRIYLENKLCRLSDLKQDDYYDNYKKLAIVQRILISALRYMHYLPVEDPYSYYSLASIHAYSDKALSHNNFCVHGSTEFTSWHRQYVLCYELSLVYCAFLTVSKEIIRYEDKNKPDYTRKELWSAVLPYLHHIAAPYINYSNRLYKEDHINLFTRFEASGISDQDDIDFQYANPFSNCKIKRPISDSDDYKSASKNGITKLNAGESIFRHKVLTGLDSEPYTPNCRTRSRDFSLIYPMVRDQVEKYIQEILNGLKTKPFVKNTSENFIEITGEDNSEVKKIVKKAFENIFGDEQKNFIDNHIEVEEIDENILRANLFEAILNNFIIAKLKNIYKESDQAIAYIYFQESFLMGLIDKTHIMNIINFQIAIFNKSFKIYKILESELDPESDSDSDSNQKSESKSELDSNQKSESKSESDYYESKVKNMKIKFQVEIISAIKNILNHKQIWHDDFASSRNRSRQTELCIEFRDIISYATQEEYIEYWKLHAAICNKHFGRYEDIMFHIKRDAETMNSRDIGDINKIIDEIKNNDDNVTKSCCNHNSCCGNNNSEEKKNIDEKNEYIDNRLKYNNVEYYHNDLHDSFSGPYSLLEEYFKFFEKWASRRPKGLTYSHFSNEYKYTRAKNNLITVNREKLSVITKNDLTTSVHGQLGFVPISGFDPFFFALHSQVERHYTLHQDLYFNSNKDKKKDNEEDLNQLQKDIKFSDDYVEEFRNHTFDLKKDYREKKEDKDIDFEQKYDKYFNNYSDILEKLLKDEDYKNKQYINIIGKKFNGITGSPELYSYLKSLIEQSFFKLINDEDKKKKNIFEFLIIICTDYVNHKKDYSYTKLFLHYVLNKINSLHKIALINDNHQFLKPFFELITHLIKYLNDKNEMYGLQLTELYNLYLDGKLYYYFDYLSFNDKTKFKRFRNELDLLIPSFNLFAPFLDKRNKDNKFFYPEKYSIDLKKYEFDKLIDRENRFAEPNTIKYGKSAFYNHYSNLNTKNCGIYSYTYDDIEFKLDELNKYFSEENFFIDPYTLLYSHYFAMKSILTISLKKVNPGSMIKIYNKENLELLYVKKIFSSNPNECANCKDRNFEYTVPIPSSLITDNNDSLIVTITGGLDERPLDKNEYKFNSHCFYDSSKEVFKIKFSNYDKIYFKNIISLRNLINKDNIKHYFEEKIKFDSIAKFKEEMKNELNDCIYYLENIKNKSEYFSNQSRFVDVNVEIDNLNSFIILHHIFSLLIIYESFSKVSTFNEFNNELSENFDLNIFNGLRDNVNIKNIVFRYFKEASSLSITDNMYSSIFVLLLKHINDSSDFEKFFKGYTNCFIIEILHELIQKSDELEVTYEDLVKEESADRFINIAYSVYYELLNNRK